MPVNDKIRKVDYNNIRAKVNGVMGAGSGNSGYGQLVKSSDVDESNRVTVNEWGNLYYDIVNCYVHQTGAAPASPTSAVENAIVKTDSDSTSVTAARSGTNLIVYGVTSGMVAIGQTVSGTGIVGTPTIIAAGTQVSITISSFTSKTGSGPYSVTFTIPAEPIALQTGVYYTIAGNSNSNYNGTFLASASTTTTLTLTYSQDPGVYGSGTTTITAAISENPWGRSTWILSTSQTLSSRTLTLDGAALQPYTQYDTFATNIVTNKFLVHSSQASTVAKGSVSQTWPNATLGAFWNGTLSSIVSVSFTTADQARYFFNSGGEIRFSSSRSGGTVAPASGYQQNDAWTNLLGTTSASPKTFGGNAPGTGTTPADGTNFYRLTSTYQIWSTSSASSPYTSNVFRIWAKTPGVASNSTGTARVVEFLVEWIDGYTASGPGVIENPAPGDQVDGTLTLAVTTYEATGILQPAGFGTFSVESPTVSITDISVANTPIYLITPSVTSVNEGGSVTFTVSGYYIPDGTYSYAISGTGIAAADFTDGTLTGSVAVSSNSGSFTKTLVNDVATEDTELFTVALKSGATTLATSGTVAIGDTSALKLITESTTTAFITGTITSVSGAGWKTISTITCTRRGTARFYSSIVATSTRVVNYRLNVGGVVYTFTDTGQRTAGDRTITATNGPYNMSIGTVITLQVDMWTDSGTATVTAGSSAFQLRATEV